MTRSFQSATREELIEAIGQLSGHAKPAKQSPAARAAMAAVRVTDIKGVQATATKTQLVLRVPYARLGEPCKALYRFELPTG